MNAQAVTAIIIRTLKFIAAGDCRIAPTRTWIKEPYKIKPFVIKRECSLTRFFALNQLKAHHPLS